MTTSILELVLHDLCDTVRSGQGARGLSAEQVLRAAILKNWHQLSYTKLAFHLSDSQSFRRFARLPWHWTPSASCLQENISRIQASTWQQINRLLVQWANARDWNGDAIDSGRFHGRGKRYPLDSQVHSIRVLTRRFAGSCPTHPVQFMITGAGPSDAV